MLFADRALLTLSCLAAPAMAAQTPLGVTGPGGGSDKPAPPKDMTLHPLAVSGSAEERINLMFFSDGYTRAEHGKFVHDARRLTADIVAPGGAMSHVRDLLNVWGVFTPSARSGLGQDAALAGAPFGLYRAGTELRAVYVGHEDVARAACEFWRGDGEAGCDQPILLGNDELYGGLGGEFTVITSSPLNGPLVLRHELGHSLIPAGEEYDGGYSYFGPNADSVDNLESLKWAKHLSDPDNLRIEDVQVPLQAYPWHDLEGADYSVKFRPTAPPPHGAGYDMALLRMSVSSIAYPSHVRVTLGGAEIDLSPSFPSGPWEGSNDRRWIEIPFKGGISKILSHTQEADAHSRPAPNPRPLELKIALTPHGRNATAGRGGRMVTSVQIVEYGGGGRCNMTAGFIGAFPTYSDNGTMTLRPMNEECLMRRVTHPTFCPVCAEALRLSLEERLLQRQLKRIVLE